MSVNLVKTNKSFGGLVKKFKHASAATATEMTFSVYFPPGKMSEKSCPCLFYLSGLTCTDDNFITKAGAQKAASEHGIALIAPDTSPRGTNLPGEHDSYDFGSGAGFYLDATLEPYSSHYRMFSYITEELPEILTSSVNQEHFGVLDISRASVFGHSMGGHGALICGLKTNLFRSISAFAPICNPINCPWGKKAFEGYLGKDVELWKAYDASELAREYKSSKQDKMHILVDQGGDDEFLTSKQLLPEALKASCQSNTDNISLELRTQSGYDHSYFFIATFIQEHLDFHAKFLFN